jgi:hypothetical protein
MNDDIEFTRWLKIMSARAVNLNRSRPIFSKHRATNRKVWFWRDGTTMIFQLDDAGYIVAEDRMRDVEIALHGRIISEEQEVTSQKLSRAEVVRQQLKALQAEMAHLARFPEDNFADGTVLQVVKTYKRTVPVRSGVIDSRGKFTWDPNSGETVDQVYVYVLLKANGQWWCTGENGHQINGASWDKVIEFVDGDELIDVRTGRSVMTDAQDPDVMYADPSVAGWIAPKRDDETVADHIGVEAAAKVDAFLDDPGVGKFMNPRLKAQED